MKFNCYICGERVVSGDGVRVEGKLIHKKCQNEYYKWLREMTV